MKRFVGLFLAAVLVLGVVAPVAYAQTGSLVQQSASRLDAAIYAATSTTSAATITITPPAGHYVYVTGVEITNCVGGTAVTAAAVTTVTTTVLGSGTTPVWTVGSGVTAGLCQPSPAQWNQVMKSNIVGTAVTFVLPTFATNQTLRVSVYYYTAP